MGKARGVRGLLAIGVLAAVHLALSFGFLLASVGAAMRRLDTGVGPSPAERLLDGVAAVLLFPLVSGLNAVLPGRWFSGLSGYVPFAANSLLWGVGIYFGLRWLGRRRRSQVGPVVSRTGSAPPS